jgi:hypothetical protein
MSVYRTRTAFAATAVVSPNGMPESNHTADSPL